MNKDFRADCKGNELFSFLYTHLGKTMNLSRIKLISQLVRALCSVQTVSYVRLSSCLHSSASVSSNLRRIQRFMSHYVLPLDLIALVVVRLLPAKPAYPLAPDRTGWKFGSRQINLPVLSVLHNGAAFPVLFSSCPSRGNSSRQQRADLPDRFTTLFGKASIASLVADREFIGSRWMNYLQQKKIDFCLRIKSNYRVTTSRGNTLSIERLFAFLKVGQQHRARQRVLQKDIPCYLTATRFINQQGRPELLVIASASPAPQALSQYRTRWQIECAFKSFKSSGFNLEDTHLTDPKRIEKLFALVCIAYTWAYRVGEFIHQKIKPIRILNNGRKAYSIVKYGLINIAKSLLTETYKKNNNIYKFLSCT